MSAAIPMHAGKHKFGEDKLVIGGKYKVITSVGFFFSVCLMHTGKRKFGEDQLGIGFKRITQGLPPFLPVDVRSNPDACRQAQDW